MPQMLRTKYRKIKGWKNMKEIKIVIADDNTYFCKFLNDYLKKYEDIEILETANNDEKRKWRSNNNYKNKLKMSNCVIYWLHNID